MKKVILMLTAALFAVSVSAQNKITVDNLRHFNEIQVNGKIEIFVTLDTLRPLSMEIEMNGNDQNQLNWWDTDSTLIVKYTPKSKGQPVMIRLNAHTLEDLNLQSTSMTIESPWEAGIVTINLATNAKLTTEIHCKDLKVTAQTGSAAVLKGTARYADYDTRSKSTLDARALAATSTTLRAGGYSECFAYGTERLIIDAYDGAAVFYRGTPEIMRKRETRGGHSNPIGE